MAVYLGNTKISGVKVGTAGQTISPVAANLTTLSVTPQESAQTFTPSGNYDGYSSVSVGAISSTYIGSNVNRRGANTITPNTSNLTIPASVYLTGTLTILGDADLLPENIKSGVEIFGVTGNYGGGVSPTGDLLITSNGVYDVETYATATVSLDLSHYGVFIMEEDDPAGGKVLYVNGLDLSQDTVDPEHLAVGYTAHNRSGESIVGTFNGVEINNQTKIVTPTTSQLNVTADSGYTGLEKVTVNAIPSLFKNTSDANATTADLLLNKVAYNASGKIVGAMPNNGATGGTITALGGTYNIPAGYTSGGTVTASLTAVALTNSIINGVAYEEATGDYAWQTSVSIPAGYHNALTLTKNFSTIFPQPNTPATSDKILIGYQAYDYQGKLVTGNMSNNNFSATLDDSTTSVNIPAGYHPGTGTVSHNTVNIPDPSISISSSGLITASGSWTKGFTTDSSYSNTKLLNTMPALSVTPSETLKTLGVSGYYMLGDVTVAAIPNNYVGSAVVSRNSADLTASGATVTVPAGYYIEAASKSVSTTTHPNPTMSLNTTTGVITASHLLTAGYVSAGTTTNTFALSTLSATTITPNETQQTAVATNKYTLGAVTVAAIPNNYVGSAIISRTSTDLSASGATVTAPAGYYAAESSKSVATATLATPSVSINTTSGLVTATANQSAGYVTAGTKSGILQLSTLAATTITPSTTSLTAVAANKYTTGVVTVAAIPSTYKNLTTTTNATASLILNGYTAYNSSGSLITGSINSKAAATYYPSATDLTITSGLYLSGTLTIKAVTATNLIAENIKKNVTILIGDSVDSDRVLSITGTYEGAGSGEVGVSVGTATRTLTTASNSISFTNLSGDPTSFVVTSSADLATGASPYKTASVVYDGSSVIGQYITNTNNAQMTYSNSAFTKSYSNGTLTITGTGTNFLANEYKLVYTYNGSSANLDTKQVLVGSGVTSITFTGLADEPIYWSCLFTSNIGTSNGYTRAHVVVNDGSNIYGMEMGSGSMATTNWTASYNNGSLTISSLSTSVGGYFHLPGYYQLTYAVGGSGEITTLSIEITSNGTYTAPRGKAYTPVIVNVPAGATSAACYAYIGMASRTANSYGATSASVTVTKAGTYTISYVAVRGSSSGTMGTNVHIGNSTGTNNTTWNNGTYGLHVQLTGQTISANTTVTIYATSGSGSRTIYVGNLIVKEET